MAWASARLERQHISRSTDSFCADCDLLTFIPTGVGNGKNYAVNFPLRDGIDDASYKVMLFSLYDLFRPD